MLAKVQYDQQFNQICYASAFSFSRSAMSDLDEGAVLSSMSRAYAKSFMSV
jgi:hypothetical protein